jgi:hypothetical protein
MADPAVRDADEHFARARRFDLDVVDDRQGLLVLL